MKHPKVLGFCFLALTLVWLGVMFRLSSANGVQTLQDSMRITRFLARHFWTAPTHAQILHVNTVLRKLAHIGLYAILGVFVTPIFHLFLSRRPIKVRAIGAIALTTVLAFADEAHKLPIEGRHFSFSESCLNAVSAAAAVLILSFIVFLCTRHHQKKVTSFPKKGVS